MFVLGHKYNLSLHKIWYTSIKGFGSWFHAKPVLLYFKCETQQEMSWLWMRTEDEKNASLQTRNMPKFKLVFLNLI